MDAARFAAALEWCRTHAVECLYFLADSDHAETVRCAEDHAFRLVDIRIDLRCRLAGRAAGAPMRLPDGVTMRRSTANDVAVLKGIARRSYTDTRFFFDGHFPEERCEALYEVWIARSCEGWADAVWIADAGGTPVGFITCHVDAGSSGGRIGLVGVAAEARGRGIGHAVVESSLRWFANQNVDFVGVATQGRNLAAQRLYQAHDFMTESVRLWYHYWVSDGPLRGRK
jgi:ribosomal protein S18 acetylase RimI-like enzyme